MEVIDLEQKVLGPRKDNIGPYKYDQDPACGYSQTITLTDLPTFMTHNEPTSKDFSIDQIDDLSLVGEYIVTIKSEIEVPDDYTMSTFSTLVSEHKFSVFVNPCVVESFEASVAASNILYNIDQPEKTGGYYEF